MLSSKLTVCLFMLSSVSSSYWRDVLPIELTSDEYVWYENDNSGYYSNLLLIRNEFLFVTGRNYVFKLNSKNISDRSGQYKERVVHATNKKVMRSNLTFGAENHLRLLLYRKSHGDLILCGTNLGKSHILDLKETDLSNHIEYNGEYLCPSDKRHANLGLIAYSLGGHLMYSALWTDDQPGNYGIFRKNIEYNGKYFVRTMPGAREWLWDPHFISIVEYADYIYFFFTELSEEDERVSRVARVCKNDKGVWNATLQAKLWTTYRKLQIECELNKSFRLYTFSLIKPLENGSSKLVAVFHERIDYGLEILFKWRVFSAMCEIDLEELGAAFIHAPRECDYNFDDRNQKILADKVYLCKFKFLLPYKLTTLATNALNDWFCFIYVSTTDGLLLVLVRRISLTGQTFIIEYDSLSSIRFSFNPNASKPINNIINSSSTYGLFMDLLVNKRDNYLYFSNEFKIYQINIDYINRKICNYMSAWVYWAFCYSTLDVHYTTSTRTNNSNQSSSSFNLTMKVIPNITTKTKTTSLYFKNKPTNHMSPKSITIYLNVTREDIKYNIYMLQCCESAEPKNRLESSSNQVRWFKDGRLIDINTSAYRLSNMGELMLIGLTRNHTGLYECRKFDLVGFTEAATECKFNLTILQDVNDQAILYYFKLNVESLNKKINFINSQIDQYCSP